MAQGSSLTDTLFSTLFGSAWTFFTGGDLLPPSTEKAAADPEDGQCGPRADGGETSAFSRYKAVKQGRHAAPATAPASQWSSAMPAMDLTPATALPDATSVGPPATTPYTPRAGESAEVGATAEGAYYAPTGEHDMVGYYVKTVGDAPVVVPTPLSPEEVASARARESEAKVSGGSAWNSGGATWETKDVSAWATDRLAQLCAAELLQEQSTDPSHQLFLAVKASPGSEASVAVVRGSLRAGFDFKLSLEWKGGAQLDLEAMDTDVPGGGARSGTTPPAAISEAAAQAAFPELPGAVALSLARILRQLLSDMEALYSICELTAL